MIVVDLPAPPSANHLWQSGRGRVYRSPAYQAWREEAAWMLKGVGKIDGPVRVSIYITPKGRGDADNRVKPVLDALVTAGVIEGDDKRYVRAVSAEWSTDMDLKGVRVCVASASSETQGQHG